MWRHPRGRVSAPSRRCSWRPRQSSVCAPICHRSRSSAASGERTHRLRRGGLGLRARRPGHVADSRARLAPDQSARDLIATTPGSWPASPRPDAMAAGPSTRSSRQRGPRRPPPGQPLTACAPRTAQRDRWSAARRRRTTISSSPSRRHTPIVFGVLDRARASSCCSSPSVHR